MKRDVDEGRSGPRNPPGLTTPATTEIAAQPVPAKTQAYSPSPLVFVAGQSAPGLVPPSGDLPANQLSSPLLLRLPEPSAVTAQPVLANSVVTAQHGAAIEGRSGGNAGISVVVAPRLGSVAASTSAGRSDAGSPFEQIKEDGILQLELNRPLLLRMKADVYRTNTADAAVANVARITAREISITGNAAGRTHITFFLDDPAKPQMTYLVEVHGPGSSWR